MTEINNQPIAPIAPVTDNYFGTVNSSAVETAASVAKSAFAD